MKILKQPKAYLAFLLTLFASVFFVGGLANAATVPTKNGANGMRISPLRTDLKVKPGASNVVPVSVTNLTDADLELVPVENDFVAGGEDGHPSIILNKDSYAPTHSLKRFMIPLKKFTLPAHETKTVKLTINVPPDAQAGGYFGALRFVPASTIDKQISLNSSVTSLVLLTVPGPTKHKLTMTNFELQQNENSAGYFNNPKNINLLVRFRNDGNIQEAPFGQVNVTKGDEQIYSYDFNNDEPKDVILPDSARRWEVPIKKLGNFGKYTVTGTFSYANGQSFQQTKSFWIIPITYIIGAIVAVIALIALIFGIRSFLKGYKKRILRSNNR